MITNQMFVYRKLFGVLLLAVMFIGFSSLALADGGEDETTSVYSDSSGEKKENTDEIPETEPTEPSEGSEVQPQPEPEPVLPAPEELFGDNLHKIQVSRSDLVYSWGLAMVKSEEIIETLKAIFAPAVGESRINLVENRPRNAIIATFPDKKDAALRKEWSDVMGTIDGPIDQVLIEVNIVELILNDIEQKGGQLRAFAESAANGQDLFQSFNMSHTTSAMDIEEKSVEGFKYYVTNGDKLKALLFSGKDRNKTKLLSSPQLIASNHKPAVFKLGQTYPILTGSTIANGITTYSFEHKDVGININMTPHFCGKGFLNLDINQEVNDMVQYDDVKKVAVFAHKTLTSNVTLKSGETVALGGYIHNKNRLNRKNSPALRKIPLIGKYLNRDVDTSEKAEIVVFITPRILKNNDFAKFKSYSGKKRFENGEKMVKKLDERFDTSDIGTRSKIRASQK
ncbi:MAG: type II and III secretion system protein, partial [Candidatus Riflebacteria bacterium]